MIETSKQIEERKAVAERLRYAIGPERGMKAKIARACNVEPQAITNWLKRGTVDRVHFPKIADVTDVSLNWLMTGNGKARPGDEEIKNRPQADDLNRSEKTQDIRELQAEIIQKTLTLNDTELKAVQGYLSLLEDLRGAH